jgi:transcriptional regulator with XRE-family HTH domain
MVSGESPAVARRRVRLALRGAREAKGLTQNQVAQALEWSLSKVNRIESGDVSISTTDLKALLEFYGVDNQATVAGLVEDARTSRRERWYTDPRYREHLTPATLQLLQFESEASAIRTFQITLIPGVMQTEAYAAAVMGVVPELSEEDQEVRLEVRMRRRQQILGRRDPPEYYLVLDESVLFRAVGGEQVMAGQLQGLLSLAKHSNVRVRVVPFAKAALIAPLGPFSILDLGDEEDAVLYREARLVDEVIHVPERIRRHRVAFEQLWGDSLNEEASARLIEARAAVMLSSLDTRPSG